jgi:hypothetical protein
MSKGYRKMLRFQQPLTIIDKFSVNWNTDASGNALFAVNMNGAPAANSHSAMFVYGSPTSVAYGQFGKFTALQALWEQCRCSWIKIKFYPSMPNDTVTVGQYNPVYVMKERDGIDFSPIATFPTKDAILSEPQSFAVNRYTPFKIFQRSVKYPVLNRQPPMWGVESHPGHNLFGQWHDCAQSINNFSTDNTAHIYAAAIQGPPSVTIGTLVVSAKFVLKGQLV